MITHKEAEILTSARQDAPLDPVVERELQAHLATCDECRAFAAATERLTAGIKAMPSIPVNPRTRREVMERVQRGRNPLAGLLAGFGGGFQTGPVLAAAATVVLIGLFGWLALDRLVFDDGGGTDENQIAAVPTEEPVERFVASPTEVPPTETAVPTEVPTEEPTVVPTDEPTVAPTEEPTVEPTAVPTEEPTSEPTAVPTEEPTAVPTEEDDPVDLTTLSEPAQPEETAEPTATTAPEPTATVAPEPTVAPTDEPTVVPTEEPTVEPEPTETPAIEPMEGTEVEVIDPTEEPEGIGSGPDIEPVGEDVSDQAMEDEATQEPDPAGIEAIGEDSQEIGPADAESTPDADEIGEEPEDAPPAGQPLVDVSVRYTGIAGDPSGHLGLTRDGRLEFMQTVDGAAFTTPGGFRLEFAESQPGVVHLCGDGFCEPAVEVPEDADWQGDVPLGVTGQTSYFMRMYSDRTEIYSASSEGSQLINPQPIAETGPAAPPTAVYENDGILFAWLETGEWLEMSGGSAQVFSGSYANPYNVRFAPLASNGPLLGYFSNGTLIVAPVTAPDSPVFSMPTDGIDFDIAPLGDRMAVIQGNDIVIYDIQGNILTVYEAGDMQPGSLIWLRGGIVYVDRNTNALYEIPETAP